MNILLIDDDELQFIYLKQFFTAIKWRESIEACNEDDLNWADLILLDLYLGRTNNAESLRALRQRTSNFVVIYSAADYTSIDFDALFRLGANGFVSKTDPVKEIKIHLAHIENQIKNLKSKEA